eukprot:7221377-Lingulodinium_polyedra.AAC.1
MRTLIATGHACSTHTVGQGPGRAASATSSARKARPQKTTLERQRNARELAGARSAWTLPWT